MAVDLSGAKEELVETVVGLAREGRDGGVNLERFVRWYLGRAHPDDVLGRDAADVCGAALSLWRLAGQRTENQLKVRVYNPRWEQHGWQSPHTVIEVVTDELPFLVESLVMLMHRHELDIQVLIHPVGRVRRDQDGRLLGVEAPDDAAGQPESMLHLEIDRVGESARLEELATELAKVLGDVQATVEDWSAMRERATEIADGLGTVSLPLDAEEVSEGADFLRWLVEDYFTFLGARDYQLTAEDGTDVLRSVPGTGLGILREAAGASPSSSRLSAEASRVAREQSLLVLTKTNARSTVHRPGRLDYVGVKLFDDAGDVVGERRFVGLYSDSNKSSCLDVPVLRHRVRATLAQAGHPPGSHAEKTIIEQLNDSPLDLLMQVPMEVLVAQGPLAADLVEREQVRQVRLFPLRDVFGRYYNWLIFLPRERYNTTTRRRIEQILRRAVDGSEVEHTASVGESLLARLLVVVWLRPHADSPKLDTAELDIAELEATLAEAIRSWEEELHDALIGHAGDDRGAQLYLRYRNAFPLSYREDFPVRTAVADIDRMEPLDATEQMGLAVYGPLRGPQDAIRFKILRAGAPMSLSEMLPLLENLGAWALDERPYEITPSNGERIWIYDLGLRLPEGVELERDAFTEAFSQAWRGTVENDGLNRLVLLAGLSWREVVVLRAICKYLRQAGTTLSQAYMEECLAGNPSIARGLLQLFRARFEPAHRGDPGALVEDLETQLDRVQSLDEDRILRRFLRTIQAMLRTNFFQTDRDGAPLPYLSFKVAPSLVPQMPRPHPQFEIFVYSPEVEGVHLRAGAIARGGLRWSDRKEDFRTEILGLMKAQTVKNAVIVPTGAKGGFVVKRPPPAADRDALVTKAVGCYRTFICGLLDITDNLVDGQVQPPPQVVCHDGDDPYLVVAADKGTATFSDTANELATARGFWLGDAFASGGSAGYDHKKMGITARGAWESVKRHFHQLGVDPQREDFTVVGIGDMSGDVFGNGMLLSEHLRLIAAFDHRHLFLDPDPDPGAGFAERQRLFELGRSSWADYDTSVISAGGGVHPRTAKSIQISEQVRAVLDISDRTLAPNELIQAILRAPVDLLWNAGIGTYVKASHESHTEVGDRSNDAVRVDARQLRAKIVAEGGNLGLTQPARIEFARTGGLINTDAVDNSAGVDCSDHEVNIKILLDRVVADGDLTGRQRNKLLLEMTDEVTELVLEDNRKQTQTLVIAATQAASMCEVHARYLHHLHLRSILDRELEFLPTGSELAERAAAGQGLVIPEFAVLLAYTKLLASTVILDSDLPDDPYLARELTGYFPTPLRERFAEQIASHPLRREIIATRVANETVNRAGTSWLFRMMEETGASACDVVSAHVASTDMFAVRELWDRILSCAELSATTQTALMLELRKLLERATRWLLRNTALPLDLQATVSEFAPGLAELAERLPDLLTEPAADALVASAQELTDQDVPPELAQTVAGFEDLFAGLDIIRATQHLDRPVQQVASVYFALADALDIDWMRHGITTLPRTDRWQTQARAAMREDLYRAHIALTQEVLTTTDSTDDPLETWLRERKRELERYHTTVEGLRAITSVDLVAAAVGLSELRNLISA